ncbi:MAG: hypothetical protein JOZ58_13340, partial [Acetobacteraceae bacterium]|nr:hypothetical protein [Acetobacteraceae bacterium]
MQQVLAGCARLGDCTVQHTDQLLGPELHRIEPDSQPAADPVHAEGEHAGERIERTRDGCLHARLGAQTDVTDAKETGAHFLQHPVADQVAVAAEPASLAFGRRCVEQVRRQVRQGCRWRSVGGGEFGTVAGQVVDLGLEPV